MLITLIPIFLATLAPLHAQSGEDMPREEFVANINAQRRKFAYDNDIANMHELVWSDEYAQNLPKYSKPGRFNFIVSYKNQTERTVILAKSVRGFFANDKSRNDLKADPYSSTLIPLFNTIGCGWWEYTVGVSRFGCAFSPESYSVFIFADIGEPGSKCAPGFVNIEYMCCRPPTTTTGIETTIEEGTSSEAPSEAPSEPPTEPVTDPEPTPDPTSEEPSTTVDAGEVATQESTPEPTTEPTSEPNPTSEESSTEEPTTESKPEPTTEEPTTEAKPKPTPEPTTEPNPTSEERITEEPTTEAKPTPTPEPTPEPILTSRPTEPEPTTDEPSSDSPTHHDPAKLILENDEHHIYIPEEDLHDGSSMNNYGAVTSCVLVMMILYF